MIGTNGERERERQRERQRQRQRESQCEICSTQWWLYDDDDEEEDFMHVHVFNWKELFEHDHKTYLFIFLSNVLIKLLSLMLE